MLIQIFSDIFQDPTMDEEKSQQQRNIPTPDVGIFPGLLNDAEEMENRPVSRGGRDYDSEFVKLSLQGGHKSESFYIVFVFGDRIYLVRYQIPMRVVCCQRGKVSVNFKLIKSKKSVKACENSKYRLATNLLYFVALIYAKSEIYEEKNLFYNFFTSTQPFMKFVML